LIWINTLAVDLGSTVGAGDPHSLHQRTISFPALRRQDRFNSEAFRKLPSMFAFSRIAFLAAVLGAASAASAKDGSLSKIDLKNLCARSVIDMGANSGESANGSRDSCVADEQEARDQIIKDWATFPAPVRTLCIQPAAYLPSYVEWLTCLQMTKDVITLRKEQTAPTTVGSGSPVRQCPVVHYLENGSIASVVAC
jgi:hypothetical protein